MAPEACAALQTVSLDGDYAAAMRIQDKLVPLHAALFVEPNPAGPKYALSQLGRVADELRLPMVPASAPTRVIIRDAMVHAGLMSA